MQGFRTLAVSSTVLTANVSVATDLECEGCDWNVRVATDLENLEKSGNL